MEGMTADRGVTSTWGGTTYKVPVGFCETPADGGPGRTWIESMHVTVNGVGGRPLEVFASIRRAGDDVGGLADALSRALSGWLQAGGDPERVIGGVEGIRGSASAPWPGRGRMIRSVPDGIAAAVRRYMETGGHAEGDVPATGADPPGTAGGTCPWCTEGRSRSEYDCAHCYGTGDVPDRTHLRLCESCRKRLGIAEPEAEAVRTGEGGDAAP